MFVLLVHALLVVSARGQADEPAVIDDARVLAELNDDDYRVRQAATRRLLSDETLTQEDLDRLYTQSVTPEQRHRLLLVARHHLISRMMQERYGDQPGQGSMGLSHHVAEVTVPADATPRTGVLVVMTLPGFPAYALLEPGDVIVDFAGEPIPDNMTPAQFQQMIRTFQQGQQIELAVVRDNAVEHVLFRLGYSQGLGEVYDTGGITLNEPYRGSWDQLRARMRALTGEDADDNEEAATEPDAPATNVTE
jgi:C-terminal processing protease CtpA/Prc